MAQTHAAQPEPPAGDEIDGRTRATRRETLHAGARAIAGLTIGSQVLAATGADGALARQVRALASAARDKPGYGDLVVRTGEMSLPEGFTAVGFGSAGEPMSDGTVTPGFHDGSAVAREGGDAVRLLRNHEAEEPGRALHPDNAYDRAATGGVTATVFDTRSGQVTASGVVLNGTASNCNGGVTPWGSWLTCEETTAGRGEGYERPHGYVFEVPFSARGPVEPRPIKAMGRFLHEAAVVDPRTSIVYMTEDNGEPADGFYRYLPDHRRQLHRGGKLEMLAVEGRSGYDTATGQRVGRALRCEWVPIAEPDPREAENRPDAVFQQGAALGAARFMGLEGATWSRGSVYFVASAGGEAEKGQIWRYTPRGRKHGLLTLLYESRGGRLLDEPDALTVSPRGAVLVCEDGDGDDRGGTNFLRALNPSGRLITFARNDTPLDVRRFDDEARRGTIGRSEWSGACYSPDGRWLFVSIQYPGKSFAITGPWEKGWL
jgi:secreted PhoX family phosphatase